MIIISPAKRQSLGAANRSTSQPHCMQQMKTLLADIVKLDEAALTKALAVSQNIGHDAWETFQAHAHSMKQQDTVACIDLYQGDVYKALDVSTLSAAEVAFMADNLRIVLHKKEVNGGPMEMDKDQKNGIMSRKQLDLLIVRKTSMPK